MKKLKTPYKIGRILTHFTKRSGTNSAIDNLKSILSSCALKGSPTGKFCYTKQHEAKGVCFTELSFNEIEFHSKNYSPYGLVFSKDFLIKGHDANPVLSMTDDMISKASWPPDLIPFIDDYQRGGWKKWSDTLVLREWRVKGDVKFRHQDVLFVLAPYKYICGLKKLFPKILLWFPTNWLGRT